MVLCFYASDLVGVYQTWVMTAFIRSSGREYISRDDAVLRHGGSCWLHARHAVSKGNGAPFQWHISAWAYRISSDPFHHQILKVVTCYNGGN